MVKDFREFVESNFADTCVVVGAAPSLETVSNHQNSTSLWLGDAHRRTSIRTINEIYVRANSEYPCLDNQQHIEELQGRNFTYIFAETVMESTIPVTTLFEASGLYPAFVFDQRHFKGLPCTPEKPCCQVLKEHQGWSPRNITIQEHLANKFGLDHHYSTGGTVALHAFALGLLLGANKIYLTGIDLPFFQRDYVYPEETIANRRTLLQKINELNAKLRKYKPSVLAIGKQVASILGKKLNLQNSQVSVFGEDFPSLFADFQYLVDLGLQNGVKTYYCSTTSNLKSLNGIIKCPSCLGA